MPAWKEAPISWRSLKRLKGLQGLCTPRPDRHMSPDPPSPFPRYKEGTLSVGENSCIDRCCSKYWQARDCCGEARLPASQTSRRLLPTA